MATAGHTSHVLRDVRERVVLQVLMASLVGVMGMVEEVLVRVVQGVVVVSKHLAFML